MRAAGTGLALALLYIGGDAAWQSEKNHMNSADPQKLVAPTSFEEMTPLSWAELPPERGSFRTPSAGVCIAARLFSMVKYQMDQCLVQFPLTTIPVPRANPEQEEGVAATKVLSLLETGSQKSSLLETASSPPVKTDNPYFDSRWCAKESDEWGMIARGTPVGYPKIKDGEFVTVLGSANSYGAVVDEGGAWTERLGDETGTQFINIATGGAGPGYYIAGWPQFQRYLTKAKAVVVQMMSGRSVAIPRFLEGGPKMLSMAVLGCDLRWKINGQGVDVLPFLETLWHKNATTARILLNEMRSEQEREYDELFKKIKKESPDTKIIFMWMSKRALANTYTPEETEQWGKIMDFPHFADKTMFERVGAMADEAIEITRPDDVLLEDWQSETVPNKYCGCSDFDKDNCSLSEYRRNFENGAKCACKTVTQDYYSTSAVHKQTAKLIGELLK
mmetsp:Transcript_10792/g.19685  ORF Transcript_10792/g.19685 Transcript_10792/m.19685 type:complete len:447 (+) Transcript_10792:99-1439(+)|eukprot:CAMPEP_0197524604 /NCGR_PEP_ID=MMETSP1318-20131121/9226_1 /TAXON_ID=552666 /ORGANISM="Partenskyella glossopodia, Strain RCC365" /LENGTH=446 /DNA_ID=CAMNT_0043077589 /DNA_START=46 /DNA_END=1386 /DNA_ORIENTATION=-